MILSSKGSAPSTKGDPLAFFKCFSVEYSLKGEIYLMDIYLYIVIVRLFINVYPSIKINLVSTHGFIYYIIFSESVINIGCLVVTYFDCFLLQKILGMSATSITTKKYRHIWNIFSVDTIVTCL